MPTPDLLSVAPAQPAVSAGERLLVAVTVALPDGGELEVRGGRVELVRFLARAPLSAAAGVAAAANWARPAYSRRRATHTEAGAVAGGAIAAALGATGAQRAEFRVTGPGSVDERIAARADFLGPCRLPGATRATYRVALLVPAEAPPTGHGEVFGVAWAVRAVLDLPHRPDPGAVAPVAVGSPLAPRSVRFAAPPLARLRVCALDLELDARRVPLGGQLVGRVRVRVREAVAVVQVRVELVRFESAQLYGTTETAEVVAGGATVAGPEVWDAGTDRVCPFALGVPADAYPCAEAADVAVHWLVRGAVGLRGRATEAAAVELDVFGGRPDGR
jgi:hypothetical protein